MHIRLHETSRSEAVRASQSAREQVAGMVSREEHRALQQRLTETERQVADARAQAQERAAHTAQLIHSKSLCTHGNFSLVSLDTHGFVSLQYTHSTLSSGIGYSWFSLSAVHVYSLYSHRSVIGSSWFSLSSILIVLSPYCH